MGKKRGRRGFYRKRLRRGSVRKQKGGGAGVGMALGMLAPMLLGTLGKMMKVNING